MTFSFFYFVVYIIYALLFSYIRYLKALWKRILKGHCNACTSIFTWLILAQKDFCKCSINKVETFWILINNRQEKKRLHSWLTEGAIDSQRSFFPEDFDLTKPGLNDKEGKYLFCDWPSIEYILSIKKEWPINTLI